MRKKPAVTRAELEVAWIVWNLGEATVRQVFEVLKKKKHIEFSTVQTHLRNLAEKKYLRTRILGRTAYYRSAVQPVQVIREVIDDIKNLLFGGHGYSFVQHLIEEHLSDEEILQLREKLDREEAT